MPNGCSVFGECWLILKSVDGPNVTALEFLRSLARKSSNVTDTLPQGLVSFGLDVRFRMLGRICLLRSNRGDPLPEIARLRAGEIVVEGGCCTACV